MSERPTDPAGWAKFYEQQARKREAQRARDERAASKKRKAVDRRPHPMLSWPDAAAHERAARQHIEQAQRAEHHRQHSPHPLAQGSLSRYRVPE